MKWRNQVTGVVVESTQQLAYPYVRVPEAFHKAILQAGERVPSSMACDTCGFVASTGAGLASHERTHEEEE